MQNFYVLGLGLVVASDLVTTWQRGVDEGLMSRVTKTCQGEK